LDEAQKIIEEKQPETKIIDEMHKPLKYLVQQHFDERLRSWVKWCFDKK